jgi:hypothetical protein
MLLKKGGENAHPERFIIEKCLFNAVTNEGKKLIASNL